MRQFEPYSLMKLPPDLAKVESVYILRKHRMSESKIPIIKKYYFTYR